MAITAAELLVRVGADTTGAQRGLDSVSQRLTRFGQSAMAMGGVLSLGVTAPLAMVGGTALRSAADFEQSMNIMQQVAGASDAQLATLTETALRLGADTSFSAGEAADAMLELAKAGMSTEAVLDSIGGVMALAAAGGVDLATAANVTASALNAFGLAASEADYVANLLAATANASAADISDLAQGLQQGGFAFAAAGQSIDSLAASLAILTNVGLTGSDAGTALKNAMIRLMAPTDGARGLMDEFGISVYDAQGNMLPMAEIIGVLNGALGGLSQEQRNAALETIFLSDGMKAMIPLLNVGQDGFLGMVEAVNEQGAAANTANARMAGLAGAMEYFSGSVDSFLIGSAQPFLGILAELVRGAADLVTWFGTLPQPVIQAGLAFGLVLAAVGPLALVVGGLSLALGTLLSPLGAVVAAVGLLAAAWATDFGGIQGKTAEVWAAVQPTLASWADWAAARLPAAWGTLRETGTTAATGLAGAWATASEALMGVWGQLVEFLAPATARMQQTFGDLAEGMAGIEFGGLAEAAGRLVEALSPLGNLLEVAVMWAGVLGVVLLGAVNLSMNAISGMLGRLPEMVQVAVDGITGVLNGLAGIVEGVTAAIKAVIDGDWSAAWVALKDAGLSALEMLGSGLEMGISLIGLMIGGLKDAIATTLSDWGVQVTEPLDEMERKVRAFWGWLTGLSWDDIWGGNNATSLSDQLRPTDGGGPLGQMEEILSRFMQWDWPGIPNWLATLEWPEWTWLSNFFAGLRITIPMPAWAQDLFDWGGPGNNADGTSYWRGGLTWVGEEGPELVNLPRGAQVWSNPESMAMAAGGGVNVTIHATVSDQIDLHELALRVAQAIQRRGV